MMPTILADGPVVVLRRHWNDWRRGINLLSDLRRFHRSWISGGARLPSPRPFVHAYVRCTDLVDGDLCHSCRHGPPPHEIKLWIVKKDSTPAVYAAAMAEMRRAQLKRANDNAEMA